MSIAIMGFAWHTLKENTMWKSVALVAGLGGMFGAILAVAGRKLAVHTDPRIEEITNLAARRQLRLLRLSRLQRTG